MSIQYTWIKREATNYNIHFIWSFLRLHLRLKCFPDFVKMNTSNMMACLLLKHYSYKNCASDLYLSNKKGAFHPKYVFQNYMTTQTKQKYVHVC